MIRHAEHEIQLSDERLAALIHQHRSQVRPALERLWSYYRNDLDFGAGDDGRLYATAQEAGLPRRLTQGGDSLDAPSREVVVENDIAWRLHSMVDFMVGKPVAVRSQADDPQLAALIDSALAAAFDANGGVSFFQDLVLLGSVYGFVDLLLRVDQLPAFVGTSLHSGAADQPGVRVPSKLPTSQQAIGFASQIVLETVEAPRAIPVLNDSDYRQLDAYLLHFDRPTRVGEPDTFLSRLVDNAGQPRHGGKTTRVTEVWTSHGVDIYEADRLVEQRTNPLGRLPLVHIQNLPQPFFYEGLSEVEPLIPLQDELNTRLSDRANRVTFQSFKMYLGKGVEGFLDRPVGPGQMWTTDNPDASIESFGGDGPNPSEDAHIAEIREAMDKTSAVTPLAAGLIGGKVGNLTSENALRIVMMGLLSRIEKKRVTYGRGIQQISRMILEAMDIAGVLHTTSDQRRVALHWPSPLPENTTQRLRDAKLKVDLGVPREQVLAELGYDAQVQMEQTV